MLDVFRPKHAMLLVVLLVPVLPGPSSPRVKGKPLGPYYSYVSTLPVPRTSTGRGSSSIPTE
jgi:hypothetical protein